MDPKFIYLDNFYGERRVSFHFRFFTNTEMTKIKLLINSEAAVENMTEEERDFHYFTVHDYDKNNFLDGLEVL